MVKPYVVIVIEYIDWKKIMSSEIEMLNQFVNQLAMCELLSAHNILQPSIAFECEQIQKFIKESYFNNNYDTFVKWWDAVVVPTVNEFYTIYQNQINGK
tara:strand:- start:383 stop:679 length:297 start_codon:yes stop_codon:yes gene_type:complete